MHFVVLCPGTPEGSTGSGSGFKASQKTGQRLEVSSDRLGEARNRTCDNIIVFGRVPWLYQYWPDGLLLFVVLCPGTPEGSTATICVFVAVFLGCTSTGRVGLCFSWFYVQELPKAQPAVVLGLKRLRRRGNGFKSHPTDWEKPGIEPATPGLQDIGLSPTPRRLLSTATICLFYLEGLYFALDWRPFICSQNSEKIRTSNGDYRIKQ